MRNKQRERKPQIYCGESPKSRIRKMSFRKYYCAGKNDQIHVKDTSNLQNLLLALQKVLIFNEVLLMLIALSA